MDDLTTTTGIVALAAAGLALVALVAAVVALVKIRRLRALQRVVLGPHGERDIVAHGAELTAAFEALRDWIEEVGQRLDGRLGAAEDRLDGTVAYRGLVRYDAYNEMSGRQSTSIALLDATRSGIVLSSIHHRDQARMYAKQVRDGQSELELSPEEEEAMRLALAGEVQEAPR